MDHVREPVLQVRGETKGLGDQRDKNSRLGCLADLKHAQKPSVYVGRRGWSRGRAWAKKDLRRRLGVLGVRLIRQKHEEMSDGLNLGLRILTWEVGMDRERTWMLGLMEEECGASVTLARQVRRKMRGVTETGRAQHQSPEAGGLWERVWGGGGGNESNQLGSRGSLRLGSQGPVSGWLCRG